MKTLLSIPNSVYARTNTTLDPARQLYAAIAARAIRDVFDPPAKLSKRDYQQAIAFVFDVWVEAYLTDAGVRIPWHSIRQMYRQLSGGTPDEPTAARVAHAACWPEVIRPIATLRQACSFDYAQDRTERSRSTQVGA